MRLCDFPILTFDTYGTLIDWETGIWDALQPLCARLADPPTREAALAAFAQVESACQAANPDLLYADLLVATHRTLAQNWGSEPDDAESIRFGQSVGDWPAFADAARIASLFEAAPPADYPSPIAITLATGAVPPASAILGMRSLLPRKSARTNHRWLTLNSFSPELLRISAATPEVSCTSRRAFSTTTCRPRQSA